MAKASDNPFPSILLVEQASTPATPAAGQARLYRGSDNQLYVVDDAGAATPVGGSKSFQRAKRTAGDVTLNSTTFTDIDTGLDLVLPAAVGDVIEARMAVRVAAASATSPWCVLDFHTIVSAAPVNSVAGDTTASDAVRGHPGWATGYALQASAGYTWFIGSKRYTVASGDLSGGNVTLRLRGRSGNSMTLAASDPHLYVEATNLGPQL